MRTDILSIEERSERMRRVRQKNTKPELTVRRLLTELGYRYRLHSKRLPGSPDVVFPSKRKVIFVHGCFWHYHNDPQCRLSSIPKSRHKFWRQKLLANRERDAEKLDKLKDMGWASLIIWQCELKDREKLQEKLADFLE